MIQENFMIKPFLKKLIKKILLRDRVKCQIDYSITEASPESVRLPEPVQLFLFKPAYEDINKPSISPGRGGLSFVGLPGSDLTRQIQYLAHYLVDRTSGKLALVGNHSAIPQLAEQISILNPNHDLLIFGDLYSVEFGTLNAPPALANKGEVMCVALICLENDLLDYVRDIVNQCQFNGRLVIPSVHDLEWPTLDFVNPKPIVEYLFPCAGTFRFHPSFDFLLQNLKWNIFQHSSFQKNSFIISNARTPDGALDLLPSFSEATESIYWRACSLDYFQVLMVHEFIDPKRFQEFKGTLVVLMRDPRDIINSMFYRSLREFDDSNEEHILRIINGYTYKIRNTLSYVFPWPDAGVLADSFVQLAVMPNVVTVRFEDLHAGEVSALEKLMKQLGLDSNPFIKLDKEHYENAAYLGTFEYQTGGKRKRGEDYKEVIESTTAPLSARKGVVGDWRSSFTPKAVIRFKELAGDALVQLGYEKDLNWEL